MENNQKSVMPAAEKAVQLLELFGEESRPLKLTEIAEQLGTNKSTTSRLLQVFEEKEWICRIGPKGPYRLTFRPMYYISRAMRSNQLAQTATPSILHLTELTECLALLVVPENLGVVCIVHSEAPQAIRVATGIGHRYSYHCNAAAKAVLAWQPDHFIDEVLSRELEKCNENTITDPKILRAELRDIRTRFYSIDREEGFIGINCIGAPIFDYQGNCIAGIGISSLTYYNTLSQMLGKKKEHLLQTAEKISRMMGWTGSYPPVDKK